MGAALSSLGASQLEGVAVRTEAKQSMHAQTLAAKKEDKGEQRAHEFKMFEATQRAADAAAQRQIELVQASMGSQRPSTAPPPPLQPEPATSKGPREFDSLAALLSEAGVGEATSAILGEEEVTLKVIRKRFLSGGYEGVYAFLRSVGVKGGPAAEISDALT